MRACEHFNRGVGEFTWQRRLERLLQKRGVQQPATIKGKALQEAHVRLSQIRLMRVLDHLLKVFAGQAQNERGRVGRNPTHDLGTDDVTLALAPH